MVEVTDWYKTTTVFLAGVVMSLVGSLLLVPRNVLTKDDLDRLMPQYIAEYSPYTGDAKNIATQLQELHDQNIATQERLRQIQIDVANISAKVHVTADPGGRQ